MYDDFKELKARLDDVKETECETSGHNPETLGGANARRNSSGAKSVRIPLVNTASRSHLPSKARTRTSEVERAIHRATHERNANSGGNGS